MWPAAILSADTRTYDLVPAVWDQRKGGPCTSASPRQLQLIRASVWLLELLTPETFCAFVASYCAERGVRTAVVDADVGQSDIGPPGTVSLGSVDGILNSLSDVSVTTSYFVGRITPERAVALCITGCRQMTDRAIGGGGRRCSSIPRAR